MSLSWKPARGGRYYCSPACGGKCTWKAYQKAKKDASAVAASLGPGWKPRVFENLDWFWLVRKDCMEISKDGTSSFTAILDGHYIGHGTTPRIAIKNAIARAIPVFERLSRLLQLVAKEL